MSCLNNAVQDVKTYPEAVYSGAYLPRDTASATISLISKPKFSMQKTTIDHVRRLELARSVQHSSLTLYAALT